TLLKHLDSDLLRYILLNNLQPGDRVPSLSELSDSLNISISKLREQLEVARNLGIVDVRPRTGIRCLPFDFMPALRTILFFNIAAQRSMFDHYSNLRVHVEMAYWHEATAHLSLEDKLALKALVGRAWDKLRHEHVIIPHAEHRAFHMGIFQRLENPFVRGILEGYWEAYEAIEFNRYADYAYLERVWTYHERIAEELLAEDHQASLEAFIEHTRLLRHQPNHQETANGAPRSKALPLRHNSKG
ncbi:MAG: FadR family transcriptional regulator, partial [Anaerolineae bacterium]|nr:FadR family transcriptional regulator [Anaerolineae bacterium]